ncbi:hypothetical protein CPHO_04960 [Corynebacterium phocae]|uniref:AMIN-like domain-containing protein n=1 Tax=Corynebacterium phocae TaxID=161895 RepID=A0A1L7D2H9_9CORY|nr:hypothetical protein [Corynebacterium phocae]APT92349.1 hypothetical protein CPHO_04960 [Corynebacterium phocae]KAA8724941.1 hypothetical protein F4V58_04495 [Corynebacterium phocae]
MCEDFSQPGPTLVKPLAASLAVCVAVSLSACSPSDGVDNAQSQLLTSTTTVSKANAKKETSPAHTPGEATTEKATRPADNGAAASTASPPAKEAPQANGLPAGFLGQPSDQDRPLTMNGPADLVPVAVRTGSHPGFDRFVIEFTGTGKPGWYARYSTEPAQQGSGFPVEYRGTTALTVGVEGTPWPFSAEKQASFIDAGTFPGAGSIRSVEFTGAFEAQSQFVLGLDEKRPYSITFLEQPSRLVIDFLKD